MEIFILIRERTPKNMVTSHVGKFALGAQHLEPTDF